MGIIVVMETQTPLTLSCPACGSSYRQTKDGKNLSGKQRYQCHDCSRLYLLDPKPRGYEAPLRQQAAGLYVEGLSFRKIARLLKVHHQTIINWIRAEEASRPAALLPENVEAVEMDELYTFVEKKTV